MNEQSKKLAELIVNKKQVEAAEMFNHLMSTRAVDRLAEVKKSVAQSLFKGVE